jgi:hypothetical protein
MVDGGRWRVKDNVGQGAGKRPGAKETRRQKEGLNERKNRKKNLTNGGKEKIQLWLRAAGCGLRAAGCGLRAAHNSIFLPKMHHPCTSGNNNYYTDHFLSNTFFNFFITGLKL